MTEEQLKDALSRYFAENYDDVIVDRFFIVATTVDPDYSDSDSTIVVETDMDTHTAIGVLYQQLRTQSGEIAHGF